MVKFKKQATITISFIIVLAIIAPIYAQAATVDGRQISSQAAVVIDFETGLVLYGHSQDAQRVPASTLKLVTAHVILDAISAGELTMDTVTRISADTSEFSRNREFSNIRLAAGAQLTIRQLLEFSIVSSACAATVALAEALSGSQRAFLTRMNSLATRLGIQARFYDCWGGSEENRISAYGMAILTRSLIDEHPEILVIATKRSVSYNGTTYSNTNAMLGQYDGIDGMKTGFTTPAGYCFIGTAQRGDRRIIAVTLGSTQSSRWSDTRILLDYGFSVVDRMVEEFFADDNPGDDDADDEIGDETDAEDGGNDEHGIENGMETYPSSANLVLDGVETPLAAYLINDAHYFKLRDIMFLLIGTEKQFGVELWDSDSKTGYLASSLSYTAVGGELSELSGPRPFMPTNSRIFFDGIECDVEIYLIDDNNYFKLRDIAIIMDFFVFWDNDTRTIIMDTTMEYEETMDDTTDETTDDTTDETTDDTTEETQPGEDQSLAGAAAASLFESGEGRAVRRVA